MSREPGPSASGTAHIGMAHYAVARRAGNRQPICDEPVAGGGADAGPSPFAPLPPPPGAGTAIALLMYAERKGWKLAWVDREIHTTLHA